MSELRTLLWILAVEVMRLYVIRLLVTRQPFVPQSNNFSPLKCRRLFSGQIVWFIKSRTQNQPIVLNHKDAFYAIKACSTKVCLIFLIKFFHELTNLCCVPFWLSKGLCRRIFIGHLILQTSISVLKLQVQTIALEIYYQKSLLLED